MSPQTSPQPLDFAGRAKALASRSWNVFRVNWHLGFTAFGGPPVHFRIFNVKFVQETKWIDEQVFQELFSVSQALCGPASTKMLYCINLIQDGFLAALFSFLLWSLPGAIGMYALAVGVSKIDETLPRPVYALLSGLNAGTVGVIALAAVELSEKAITDRLTRILVFLGATAGMLYNALWYFPVLMLASGIATLINDLRWMHQPVSAIFVFGASLKGKVVRAWPFGKWPGRSTSDAGGNDNGGRRNSVEDEESIEISSVGKATATSAPSNTVAGGARQRAPQTSDLPVTEQEAAAAASASSSTAETEPRIIPSEFRLDFSWKIGTAIIVAFFATFIAVMVTRGVFPNPPGLPLLYHLFANMYLAGTIIFGGGPVVIPLLREYVVAEGWVNARDFLIGLALIQAFPGPNFNFAVFLGALTAIGRGQNPVAGAIIAWVGIFSPGLILVHGTMGIWSAVRSKRWVKALIRGVNASAVGLIYTAVYRIWCVGYIDEGFQFGKSLGDDPWWVVVTATSYVGGRWFNIKAPVAIMLGAVMGMIRYGVVTA
ncbi:chromate transporter-domain-containing protein [Sordaria brevicollis]|uniref:Chromate transporter-domain-containing protein n=1 Tax=Sordaria brevicollis TaxID=83679 RepID=A0AAE0UGI9_SORBR|nr:chromate transporter-domain-containing protein [Sordaria brevicollis]